jgi:hypothetical protein
MIDLQDRFAEWLLSLFDNLLDLVTFGDWSKAGGDERFHVKVRK